MRSVNDTVEVDALAREIYRMDHEGDPEVMLAKLDEDVEYTGLI